MLCVVFQDLTPNSLCACVTSTLATFLHDAYERFIGLSP